MTAGDTVSMFKLHSNCIHFSIILVTHFSHNCRSASRVHLVPGAHAASVSSTEDSSDSVVGTYTGALVQALPAFCVLLALSTPLRGEMRLRLASAAPRASMPATQEQQSAPNARQVLDCHCCWTAIRRCCLHRSYSNKYGAPLAGWWGFGHGYSCSPCDEV